MNYCIVHLKIQRFREANSTIDAMMDFISKKIILHFEGVMVTEDDESDEPECHGNDIVDGADMIGITIGKVAQSAGEAVVSGFCSILRKYVSIQNTQGHIRDKMTNIGYCVFLAI